MVSESREERLWRFGWSAGRHGQFVTKFVSEGRIYLTWGGLDDDLSSVTSKPELNAILAVHYPMFGVKKLGSHTGQIWRFAKEITSATNRSRRSFH